MSLREFYHLPRPAGGAAGRIRARLFARLRELQARAAGEYDLARLLGDLGPPLAYRTRDVALAVRRLEWLLDGPCVPLAPDAGDADDAGDDPWCLERARVGIACEDARLDAGGCASRRGVRRDEEQRNDDG
jgi:hypothetical protein